MIMTVRLVEPNNTDQRTKKKKLIQHSCFFLSNNFSQQIENSRKSPKKIFKNCIVLAAVLTLV